jgi:hypothetical protein
MHVHVLKHTYKDAISLFLSSLRYFINVLPYPLHVLTGLNYTTHTHTHTHGCVFVFVEMVCLPAYVSVCVVVIAHTGFRV